MNKITSETIIEESGWVEFVWNWISSDGSKTWKRGDREKFHAIKREPGRCKCNGYVNTYWAIGNSWVPESRAKRIQM